MFKKPTRGNGPSVARRLTVAVILGTIAVGMLSGCKGGGAPSSEASSNIYYDVHADTLGDAPAASRTKTIEDAREPTTNLQWNAPATRADGSKLYAGEIRGYRIYYKLRHRDAYSTINIEGASSTSYPLDGFTPGVYDFSVSTLDTEGLESQRSQVVSVNII